MRRILSVLAMAAFAICASAQIGAYVLDDAGECTNIRNAPRGKVVKRLARECSYMMRVRNVRDGWWEIVPNTLENAEDGRMVNLDNAEGPCYIHYSVIALDTRNYGGQRLCLRKSPGKDGAVTFSFREEISVRPVGVSGGWVKVQTTDRKHTGWIEYKWLCPNPLTNCS